MASILGSGVESTFVARGLGRSYGDAALNDCGGVIVTDRANHFLAFNEDAGVLQCEGGVSLAEIVDVMLPRGYFLPVTPGTRHVTMGGAIAADVHGKNHHRCGTIASFLRSFQLLTPEAHVLDCSREQNPDVFWATIGGMGLTGVVLTAEIELLQVESAWMAVDYERAMNLDHAINRFAETDARSSYSVAWIDCLARGRALGRSILMRGEHTRLDELPASHRRSPLQRLRRRQLSVPFDAPSWMLNALSVRALNALYYWRHSSGRTRVPIEAFFYPLDGLGNWNRLYGRRGFLQYQFVLPIERSADGMRRILEVLAKDRRASFLAVLKSFGDRNDGILSFPMRGHTLALDLPYTGQDVVAILRRLNSMVIEYGGRVYLAKDAILNREEFHLMYPNADRFKAIKRQLDPRGVLSSSLARRVGLTDNAP